MFISWWARKGSNLWLLPCEGSTLPLSYVPRVESGGTFLLNLRVLGKRLFSHHPNALFPLVSVGLRHLGLSRRRGFGWFLARIPFLWWRAPAKLLPRHRFSNDCMRIFRFEFLRHLCSCFLRIRRSIPNDSVLRCRLCVRCCNSKAEQKKRLIMSLKIVCETAH